MLGRGRVVNWAYQVHMYIALYTKVFRDREGLWRFTDYFLLACCAAYCLVVIRLFWVLHSMLVTA